MEPVQLTRDCDGSVIVWCAHHGAVAWLDGDEVVAPCPQQTWLRFHEIAEGEWRLDALTSPD